MSNLALKFLAVGFLNEAQGECNRALALANYHKNSGSTLAKLKETPDDEDEREQEILGGTKLRREFYVAFGSAASQVEPNDLDGRWQGPDSILDVASKEGRFAGSGTYDQAKLLNPLLFASSATPREATDRYQVKYEGILEGRAVQAQVTREMQGGPGLPASLLGPSPSVKVLMIVSGDEAEIRAMELAKASNPRFYTLKRMISST